MAETKKAQNLENQQEDVFDTVSNASRSSNEEKPNVRRSYKEEVNITKLQHNNVNCVEEPLLKFVDNRKNLKEDSIYVNILKQIIITDTSILNWNKYGQQGFKLNQIGDIFSDNILLAGLTPVQLITRDKDTNMKNSGVAIEIHRKTINNFFTLYNIPVRADKIQLAGVRLADGENGHVCVKNEETIEKVYKFFMDRLPEKQDELSTGKREILAQYFKVELSSLDYKYVIDAFSKKNIKYLINNFVYIGDIDFTLDMQGSFNKQEIINYLLTQKNFRMQHVTEDNEENRNFYNGTILDNNHLVGRNCLSFMQDNIRYKVYNKFVQSIETKNNKDKIGTNIYNWINNKEDRLYNTIPQTQETGHTRLELTYYVKNNEIPTREYIEETINYLHNLIPEKLTYKTPIKEQWRAYVENKQDNVILYDMDNKNLLVCYSINKDYNKISGVFLKGVTEYDYIYVLRNCLYKMPINLYLLSWILKPEKKLKTSYTTGETGKREKVTTEVETEIKYIKLSSYLVDAIKENMDTYIITPKNIYFTKDKAQATIKNKKLYTPQEQGLIDTDKINFRYAEDDGKDKKHNKNVIKILTVCLTYILILIYPSLCIKQNTKKN